MIKKIRSKLSVKVFFLTVLLMTTCCAITYWCIARFAPYIYANELSDAEEVAEMLAIELSYSQPEDAQYIIPAFQEIISSEYNDEFVFHMFKDSGVEIVLPYLDMSTDTRISDYEHVEKTKEYRVMFADGTNEYILLLTKNTKKESQIMEALQKSIPVISLIVLAVSVIAAFFYTWYITKPIKKVSKLSKQMAALDFGGSCPVGRIDEIGVLSDSLNTLSRKLTTALFELQEANRKLQADIDMERQLERQRLDFFSAVSHELKTPVTIIKGQLQGMLYQVGRYKDRETYLSQAIEVTDTLENMVQELLTISRLDTPGYTCRKRDVDLSRLIEERLFAYEDLFMQKELTVNKSILPEIHVLGDVQLLQKVLDNLLGNAAAYSGAGNYVSVKLWKEAERAVFIIENTGVHIPDEDIPKLFEAFYRVDQSRSRQTGGTGLGLYIVKTILDLHNAEITVGNTKEGVIFSVYF